MLRLSASRIQTYLACPLRYRFRYVDKIPAPWRPAALAFGSSIHAAAEWFHRERFEGRQPTADQVLEIFRADWFAQNLEPLVFGDRDSRESLDEKGRAMLALYVEKANGAAPRFIEERFETDLADPETGEALDLKLLGVIDLVDHEGTLVELKTGARRYSRGDVDRHLQLSLYALATFLITGRIPDLRIDLLLKTKEPKLERYRTSRTLEDLGWTARLVRGVGQAIESDHFYPSPSWQCTECEYFGNCQSWRD